MNGEVRKATFRAGLILTLALGLAAPVWCGSTVISTTGQVQLVGLPASLTAGADESDSLAVAFTEQRDYTLRSSLTIDANLSGTYDTLATLTSGTINAGTTITDTYLHIDPVLNSGIRFSGSLTFGSDILGVIALNKTLSATDSILGAAGSVYPDANNSRGFEFISGQDQFSISSDLRTLSFSSETWSSVDDLRVITRGSAAFVSASSATPEPGTLLLLPAGFAAIFWFRRKRQQTA